MKPKIISILAGTLLSLLIVYLLAGNRKSTLSKKRTDFAFSRSQLVNMIVIEKQNKKLTLVRQNNQWQLTNGEKVNNKMVHNLFGVVKLLKMHAPVSREKYHSVSDSIIKHGTSLSFLDGKKKLYELRYIEMNNRNIALNSKNAPFYITVPGHSRIALEKMASNDAINWKDKLLINFSKEQIASVLVDFPEQEKSSYSIINKNNAPKLLDTNKKEISNTLQEKLSDYLHFFKGISYETFDTNLYTAPITNSIFGLEINLKKDISLKINAYPVYNKTKKERDKNIFAGVINLTDTVILKYSDFDPIILSKEYFIKK